MCGTREMTLGEEIISLSNKGVDISTIERMYKKYIDETTNISHKKANNLAVGNNVIINLRTLGKHTATIYEINKDYMVLIFDNYVCKRSMNDLNTNDGGFEQSDLHEWLCDKFNSELPTKIADRCFNITIPSVEQIFGLCDENGKLFGKFEFDKRWSFIDLTYSLMENRKNRIACYENDFNLGWLKNATDKRVSSSSFAIVNSYGYLDFCNVMSDEVGVRPELWLSI